METCWENYALKLIAWSEQMTCSLLFKKKSSNIFISFFLNISTHENTRFRSHLYACRFSHASYFSVWINDELSPWWKSILCVCVCVKDTPVLWQEQEHLLQSVYEIWNYRCLGVPAAVAIEKHQIVLVYCILEHEWCITMANIICQYLACYRYTVLELACRKLLFKFQENDRFHLEIVSL